MATEIMRTRAKVEFYTNANNVVRLSIPRANPNLTGPQAAAGMQALLDTEAIVTSSGIPRTIRSGKLVKTTRTFIV